jgi:hypothetical protein
VKAANVVVVTGARGIAAATAGCHGASRLSVAPKYQKCLCRSAIKTLEIPKTGRGTGVGAVASAGFRNFDWPRA